MDEPTEVDRLRQIIADLLAGIRAWASDEDGLPESLVPAYFAATTALNWEIGTAGTWETEQLVGMYWDAARAEQIRERDAKRGRPASPLPRCGWCGMEVHPSDGIERGGKLMHAGCFSNAREVDRICANDHS